MLKARGKLMLKNKKLWLSFGLLLGLSWAAPAAVSPQNFSVSNVLGSVQFSQNVMLMLSLALVSLLPFFLMTTTSFLRVVIVLGFVRSAIGTQQTPPSAIIVSIALFLTMYIMTPVWQEINDTAIKPYNDGVITQEQAFERGITRREMLAFQSDSQSEVFCRIFHGVLTDVYPER